MFFICGLFFVSYRPHQPSIFGIGKRRMDYEGGCVFFVSLICDSRNKLFFGGKKEKIKEKIKGGARPPFFVFNYIY